MERNELCVFVANPDRNVGKYINIITHAVTFLNVISIKFIELTNNDTLQDFDIAEFVRKQIHNKLFTLSRDFPQIYNRTFDVFSNYGQDVRWDYLLLKRIVMENDNKKTFYDLTSLPKTVSIDIFVKLLSYDAENIINFECLNVIAMRKDYHELLPQDFRVVRLVDEDSFVCSVKKYARIQNANKMVTVIFSTITAIIVIHIFLPENSTQYQVLTYFAIFSGVIPLMELLELLDMGKLINKTVRRFRK